MEKEFLNFNDKEWIVMLTRKAMIKIEEAQKNITRKMADDESTIDVLSRLDELQSVESKIQEIEKMKDGKAKNDKLAKYMKEYLPLMFKAQSSDVLNDPLTAYEVIYIVITCNPHNPELTKNDYEKGLFELEERYGIIELEKKFKGMYDKVFQEIDLIRKALGQTDQVENKVGVN